MKNRLPFAASVLATIAFYGCAHAPSDRTRGLASNGKEVSGFFNNADESESFNGSGQNGTPIYKILESARNSIDIEIYEITDHGVRQAIRSALARKVRVRIVKDPLPLGEKCSIFIPIRDPKGATTGYRLADVSEPKIATRKVKGQEVKVEIPTEPDCQDQRSLAREVINAGGAYAPFNKPELCAGGGTGCYEHGKMVIADGRMALLSTGNFNSSNLCNLNPNPITRKGPEKCNRDYSFVINSDASPDDRDTIRVLQMIFEQDLAQRRYDVDSILGLRNKSAVSRRITVSPYSLAPLIELIGSAQKTLVIQNQYLKEPSWNQAIIAAAGRGVRVSLSLASLCSFGKPNPTAAAKATELYSGFEQAGIAVKFFTSKNAVRGMPGYMHAKAIVVDGRRAWMGSVNGSSMSTSKNREYGVFFDDPASVRQLEATILRDLAARGNETWQESLECAKDGSPFEDDGDEVASQ